jgi:sugar phosphate isomerase/epimerase
MRHLPTFLFTAALWLSLAIGGNSAASENPFFALCVGTHDPQSRTPADQAKLLKELGYLGMAHVGLDGVPEVLKAVDQNGLKLFAIYVYVSIDPSKPKYDPRLKEVIVQLNGRDTLISPLLSGLPPSSVEGDPRAVEVVREIADMAAASGLRVALYPHTNDWLERVEDTVRVAEKADRKNVGVTFNLCHWLKVDDEKNLEAVLKLARPHLFVVTINGADSNAKNAGWDRLIQTLDRGSFDNGKVLNTLRDLGYTGPVGLQCYGIGGDVRDNLTRSIEAWRKLSAAAK